MSLFWIQLRELDERSSARLRLNQTHGGRWKAATFLAHSGDSWLWVAGLGLVWLLGGPEWHARSALLAIAVCCEALVVFGVKQLIRRERPAGEWGTIYRSIDPHSFPSGHATRCFLLALMALVLGPTWFGLVLVIWAPLVSLARVATGVHYLSDVAAGLVIGLLMGWGMLEARWLVYQLAPFLF